MTPEEKQKLETIRVTLLNELSGKIIDLLTEYDVAGTFALHTPGMAATGHHLSTSYADLTDANKRYAHYAEHIQLLLKNAIFVGDKAQDMDHESSEFKLLGIGTLDLLTSLITACERQLGILISLKKSTVEIFELQEDLIQLTERR